ncbi:MAG: hypothetical protein JSW18_03895 [Candidatus Omnitrophota bacterium]|nr:MAG: hypothetical protein JSW18_03895 [Candidatus Omnitrophota bacterium]
MNWNIVVMDSVREMLTRVGVFIPRLIGVLLILIIGWLIAKLIELVIVRVLKLIRLDTLSERSGTSNFLAKGGIKYTLSELLGVLAYWTAMLIVIMTALNALQWTVAAELLNKVVAFIPNIIVAVFVLVIGMFVSAVLAGVVRTAASNAGIKQARLLGQITQVVVVIFAVVIALEQLNIGKIIIASAVQIILAAIGLGVAIAFGVGCKDIAGKYVSDLINKLKEK